MQEVKNRQVVSIQVDAGMGELEVKGRDVKIHIAMHDVVVRAAEQHVKVWSAAQRIVALSADEQVFVIVVLSEEIDVEREFVHEAAAR